MSDSDESSEETERVPYIVAECEEGYLYVDDCTVKRQPRALREPGQLEAPWVFVKQRCRAGLPVVQRARRRLRNAWRGNRRCRSQSPAAPRAEPQQQQQQQQQEEGLRNHFGRVRNASGEVVDFITSKLFGKNPSRRRVRSEVDAGFMYESSGSLVEVRRATYWVQQQGDTSMPCQTQWLSLDDPSVRNSRAGTLAMDAAIGARFAIQPDAGTDDYTLVAFVQDTENPNLFYLQVRIAPNRFTFFGVNRLSPSVIERGPADTLEMFCLMPPNTTV